MNKLRNLCFSCASLAMLGLVCRRIIAAGLNRGAPLRVFSGKVILVFLLSVASAADADDTESILRIGTGGSGGSYFPIGSLIARIYSELDTVLAVAQRSNGSVSNVHDIGNNLLEAALAQSDIVHWAYHGDESFEASGAIKNLRTLSSLYLENVHFVVREGSGISSLRDLSGKLVSTDEIGSGTQINIQHVLRSEGLTELDIKWVYLKPIDAMDRLRVGKLDAFFMVAGYPISGITELIRDGLAKLLPLGITDDSDLLKSFPFFTLDDIPRQAYGNEVSVTTLAVPAQLVVNAALDEQTVYELTRKLWDEATLATLQASHPKGSEVRFDAALSGLSAPLHKGAERYYRERAHPQLGR